MPQDQDNVTGQKNFLSTVGELNLIKVLAVYENSPVIIVAAAFWTKETITGHLEVKGDLIRKLWFSVLDKVDNVPGCRLLWNSIFFMIPSKDIAKIRNLFQSIISNIEDMEIDSYIAMAEITGNGSQRLDLLETLQDYIIMPRGIQEADERINKEIIVLLNGKTIEM